MPASGPLALAYLLVLAGLSLTYAAPNATVCDASCQSQQRDALLQLFAALGGPSWKTATGFGSNSSHCTWHGVVCCEPGDVLGAPDQCKENGPVVAVEWEVNNLQGTLPPEPFTALAPTLMLLDLRENNISGSLPDTLVSASLLRVVHLSGNQLTGTVPQGLEGLLYLNSITLAHNRLTGRFTPNVSNWKELRWLHLEGNCISGGFPVEVLALPVLESVNFQDNCLTGSLPADAPPGVRQRLGGLLQEIAVPPGYQTMTEVSLHNNSLTGVIPAYLVNVPAANVYLSMNNFTGPLPDWTRNDALSVLMLDNNQLTGTVPDNYLGWHMRQLGLSFNNLTGSLPADLGPAGNLDQLNLGFNSFTGGLPPSYAALAAVEYLDLQHNNFSRGNPLPPWLQLNTRADRMHMVHIDSRLLCQPVHTVAGPGNVVLLDPSYYGFEGCVCDDGYVMTTTTNPAGRITSLICSLPAAPPQVDLRAVLIPLLVTVAVLLLLLGLVFKFGLRAIVAQMRGGDKKSPPGASHEVTLVLTDVQGSTELWEWDTELAAEAFLLHDRLLRTFMAAFYGYEVSTEGDAFLVAFHEPFDAVAWCLAVQLALHYADWPTALLGHAACAEETASSCQEKRRRRTRKWEDKMAANMARTTGGGGPPAPGAGPGALGEGGESSAASSQGGAMSPGAPNNTSFLRGPGASDGGASGGGVDLHGLLPPGMLDLVEELSSLSGGEEGRGPVEAAAVAAAAKELMAGQQVLFRGLRVRMSVATGAVDAVRLHSVTQRAEYSGDVLKKVQAVSEAPHGGQVLIDPETFKGIHARLPELGGVLLEVTAPMRAAYDKQAAASGTADGWGRTGSSLGSGSGSASPTGAGGPGQQGGAPAGAPWRWLPSWGGASEHSSGIPNGEGPGPHSAAARAARAGLMEGRGTTSSPRTTTSSRGSLFSSFRRWTGSGMNSEQGGWEEGRGDIEEGVMSEGETGSEGGGRGRRGRKGMLGAARDLLRPNASKRWWRALPGYNSKQQRGNADLTYGVMVIDMGVHELSGMDTPICLTQVMPCGLEDRARFFPRLDSLRQETPGFFDAPAAGLHPLQGPFSPPVPLETLPPVTIVFCCIEKYAEMMAANREVAEATLALYSDCVRWLLLAAGGYECQEAEGTFMVAFAAAEAALEWCLMAQQVLRDMSWPASVLDLPMCEEERDMHGNVVFRGPRVKMGIYAGVPSRVVPHTTTGRADYFGPVVNRAARYCHAAARGGQVLIARDLMVDIIAGWMGSESSAVAGERFAEYCVYWDPAARRIWPWLFMRRHHLGVPISATDMPRSLLPPEGGAGPGGAQPRSRRASWVLGANAAQWYAQQQQQQLAAVMAASGEGGLDGDPSLGVYHGGEEGLPAYMYAAGPGAGRSRRPSELATLAEAVEVSSDPLPHLDMAGAARSGTPPSSNGADGEEVGRSPRSASALRRASSLSDPSAHAAALGMALGAPPAGSGRRNSSRSEVYSERARGGGSTDARRPSAYSDLLPASGGRRMSGASADGWRYAGGKDGRRPSFFTDGRRYSNMTDTLAQVYGWEGLAAAGGLEGVVGGGVVLPPGWGAVRGPVGSTPGPPPEGSDMSGMGRPARGPSARQLVPPPGARRVSGGPSGRMTAPTGGSSSECSEVTVGPVGRRTRSGRGLGSGSAASSSTGVALEQLGQQVGAGLALSGGLHASSRLRLVSKRRRQMSYCYDMEMAAPGTPPDLERLMRMGAGQGQAGAAPGALPTGSAAGSMAPATRTSSNGSGSMGVGSADTGAAGSTPAGSAVGVPYDSHLPASSEGGPTGEGTEGGMPYSSAVAAAAAAGMLGADGQPLPHVMAAAKMLSAGLPAVDPLPAASTLHSLRLVSPGRLPSLPVTEGSSGFDGPSIGSTCAAVMSGAWLWVRELLVHDLGTFKFKGVAGAHSIVSVTIDELAGRTFPTTIRKGKGEQLTAGKGLTYILYMLPASQQLQGPGVPSPGDLASPGAAGGGLGSPQEGGPPHHQQQQDGEAGEGPAPTGLRLSATRPGRGAGLAPGGEEGGEQPLSPQGCQPVTPQVIGGRGPSAFSAEAGHAGSSPAAAGNGHVPALAQESLLSSTGAAAPAAPLAAVVARGGGSPTSASAPARGELSMIQLVEAPGGSGSRARSSPARPGARAGPPPAQQ